MNDWGWHALSIATALACGLLIGIERGFDLRGLKRGDAGRGRSHLHLARPRVGLAGPRRAVRPTASPPGPSSRAARRCWRSATPTGRASSRKPDATTPIAALTTVGLGFIAGFGEPGFAIAGAAVVTLILALKAELHGFLDRLDEDDVKALARYAVIALGGAAVPAQRPVWAARRVESAEAVAGGRAGHRLLVPRLCRQPHFRRAQRHHRHRGDRRRRTARPRSPRRWRSGSAARSKAARNPPESRWRPRSCTCASLLLVAILATRVAVPNSRSFWRPRSSSARSRRGSALSASAESSDVRALPGNPIAILPALGFLAFVAIAAVAARWAAGPLRRAGHCGPAADRRVDRRRYGDHHSGRASTERDLRAARRDGAGRNGYRQHEREARHHAGLCAGQGALGGACAGREHGGAGRGDRDRMAKAFKLRPQK